MEWVGLGGVEIRWEEGGKEMEGSRTSHVCIKLGFQYFCMRVNAAHTNGHILQFCQLFLKK